MCPAEEPIPEHEPKRSPLVLVVEDEMMIRIGVAQHLRDCGFQVAEATNGAEAQALVLAGLEADLVFSDIQMPDTDGVALALWLRDHGVKAPIVLTSGMASSLDAAKQACQHVSMFVSKPYEQESLVRHFRALISAGA